MDVTEDNKDTDWNFVPTYIISHTKRIIPKKVIKRYIDGKIVLKV